MSVSKRNGPTEKPMRQVLQFRLLDESIEVTDSLYNTQHFLKNEDRSFYRIHLISLSKR